MTEIQKLLDIMRALRDPETGCPWDRRQTFKTIAPYTIEEAYEVADAIETGDMDELQSELGDLLLQVVYHAQIADEENHFNFTEVVACINKKLVARHPHIFGSVKIDTAEAQSKHWESIKVDERKTKAESNNHKASVLDGISLNMPALCRAQKLQVRAAQVGFDWDDIQSVFAKIDEEVGEIREAINDQEDKEKLTEELGDTLFVCVNLARHMQIDAEAALRSANKKFQNRFRYIETKLEDQNKAPEDVTLQELDRLWDEAKQQLV